MALPYTDDFTDTNGVQLTAHSANWTKVTSGDPDIQTNGLAPDVANDDQWCYLNSETPGNDQYAEIVFKSHGTDGDYSVAGIVRSSTTQLTGYVAYWNRVGVPGAAYIFRVINNSWTQLGSYSVGLVNGDVLRLEAEGDQITLKLNGATVIGPITDNNIASGRLGIHAYGDAADHIIESWTGGNLGAVNETVNALPGAAFGTGVPTSVVSTVGVSALPGVFLETGLPADVSVEEITNEQVDAQPGAGLASGLPGSVSSGVGIAALPGGVFAAALQAVIEAGISIEASIGAAMGYGSASATITADVGIAGLIGEAQGGGVLAQAVADITLAAALGDTQAGGMPAQATVDVTLAALSGLAQGVGITAQAAANGVIAGTPGLVHAGGLPADVSLIINETVDAQPGASLAGGIPAEAAVSTEVASLVGSIDAAGGAGADVSTGMSFQVQAEPGVSYAFGIPAGAAASVSVAGVAGGNQACGNEATIEASTSIAGAIGAGLVGGMPVDIILGEMIYAQPGAGFAIGLEAAAEWDVAIACLPGNVFSGGLDADLSLGEISIFARPGSAWGYGIPVAAYVSLVITPIERISIEPRGGRISSVPQEQRQL